MKDELEKIWQVLEKKINDGDFSGTRAYRRLDLEKETGIRAGVFVHNKIRELLIQIDSREAYTFIPPRWAGMRFETIEMEVPEPKTAHIRLYLESNEHRDVFTTVCNDIIQTLFSIESPLTRMNELQNCLDKWTNFFKKFGVDGLSREAQMGLFGELRWLERIIESGISLKEAVDSWKGCERSYHDFEKNGKIIEVKTTSGKEPRKVWINNERQLDERGLKSLTLYVLTLHRVESGAMTLPDMIKKIKDLIGKNMPVKGTFEEKIAMAGYLDIQESSYITGYIRKKEEMYNVVKGFPRILEVPSGTGDITYSLTLSACSGFEVDQEKTIMNFIRDE